MATKMFNIRIDEHLHKKFKDYCYHNNIQMTDVVIGCIQNVVDGNEKAKLRQKEKMPDYDPLAAIRSQYD